jgi:hypothetical protein
MTDVALRDPVVIPVDARNRVSLGSLVGDHKYFLATVETDGTIVLVPAVVQPATQKALK